MRRFLVILAIVAGVPAAFVACAFVFVGVLFVVLPKEEKTIVGYEALRQGLVSAEGRRVTTNQLQVELRSLVDPANTTSKPTAAPNHRMILVTVWVELGEATRSLFWDPTELKLKVHEGDFRLNDTGGGSYEPLMMRGLSGPLREQYGENMSFELEVVFQVPIDARIYEFRYDPSFEPSNELGSRSAVFVFE